MKGSPERQALEEALKDESVGSAKIQALGDYAMLKDTMVRQKAKTQGCLSMV